MIRQRNIGKQFEDDISKQVQSGTASFDDSAEKIVFIFDRKNMELLGACNVDQATGDWSISIPYREDQELMSICRDEGNQFNSDIYDRTSSCTVSYSPNSYHDNLII